MAVCKIQWSGEGAPVWDDMWGMAVEIGGWVLWEYKNIRASIVSPYNNILFDKRISRWCGQVVWSPLCNIYIEVFDKTTARKGDRIVCDDSSFSCIESSFYIKSLSLWFIVTVNMTHKLFPVKTIYWYEITVRVHTKVLVSHDKNVNVILVVFCLV